jgi:hypothetical protein
MRGPGAPLRMGADPCESTRKTAVRRAACDVQATEGEREEAAMASRGWAALTTITCGLCLGTLAAAGCSTVTRRALPASPVDRMEYDAAVAAAPRELVLAGGYDDLTGALTLKLWARRGVLPPPPADREEICESTVWWPGWAIPALPGIALTAIGIAVALEPALFACPPDCLATVERIAAFPAPDPATLVVERLVVEASAEDAEAWGAVAPAAATFDVQVLSPPAAAPPAVPPPVTEAVPPVVP